MKRCKSCGQEKELSQFFRRKRSKDGYNASCKDCCNQRTTSSRRKSMQHYNVAKSNQRKRMLERFAKWKESKGCHCCEETFSYCLELHHLDPTKKEFVPSQLATGSWERFMEEAKKCIVVCANCHRKIHYGDIMINPNIQYIFD